MSVFASPGTPTEQAMPARKNRREDLLDHGILPDDDLLQLALHEQPMLPKFLQHIAQIARLRRDAGVVDMACQWTVASERADRAIPHDNPTLHSIGGCASATIAGRPPLPLQPLNRKLLKDALPAPLAKDAR